MNVKTMRGKVIDMGRLMMQHAQKRALGNASMNARGDIIEANGQVVKTRENLARDYHRNNPKAVKMPIHTIAEEVLTPEETWKQVQAQAVAKKKSTRKIEDAD